MFQTSNTTDADSTTLSTYDDFVRRAASGGNGHIRSHAYRFKALGSSNQRPAREHVGMWDAGTSSWMDSGSPIPVYWLNGPRVAQSYSDFFDGSWENFGPQHRRLESGATNGNRDTPWTGTSSDGTIDTMHYLGLGHYRGIRVGGSAIGENPMSHSTAPRGPSNSFTQHSMYGVSPVFRVTPESGVMFRVCPGGGCDEDSDTGWVETTTPHLTMYEGEQGVYQYKLYGHFPEP